MGRKQFTQLPAAPAHYQFYDPARAQVNKEKAFQAAQRSHDQHTSFLPMFQPGSPVILQDPHTGLWNQEGVVTKVREDKLSYTVQVGNRLFVRSRKMLKLLNGQKATTKNDSTHQSNNTATAANTCDKILPHFSPSKQATRGQQNRRHKAPRGQQRSPRGQQRTRGRRPQRQQATKDRGQQRNPGRQLQQQQVTREHQPLQFIPQQ